MTPAHANVYDISPAFLDSTTVQFAGFVERMRVVRRRIARWLPSSHSAALWSTDFTEIYRAATRLERAVSELDEQLKEDVTHADQASLKLQFLLCNLEARAEEFEESILETVAVA